MMQERQLKLKDFSKKNDKLSHAFVNEDGKNWDEGARVNIGSNC